MALTLRPVWPEATGRNDWRVYDDGAFRAGYEQRLAWVAEHEGGRS